MHLVRQDRLAQKIDVRFDLSGSSNYFLISVVIEAEIRALANELSWGPAKRRSMEYVLSPCTIVPIPFAGIVEAYVNVSEFSRQSGRIVGKNDVWIAATSIVTRAILLTTDKDFDHLDPVLITRH